MFGRRRLEHHLVLVVVLQPVRVLAVAAVLGAAARLHVGGLPGLGAERAQEGRGVAGAGADLHVVGLQQRAALLGPVGLQSRMICWKSQHRARGRRATGRRAAMRRVRERAILGAAPRRATARSDAATAGRAATAATGRSGRPSAANGVSPLRPSTVASSMPRVNGGSAAVTPPRWSITAVAPVLVARIIGRCELERAHARDLQVLVDRDRLAEPADVADVGEDRRRLSPRRRSAPRAPRRTGPRSRCWARRARRRTANDGAVTGPRLKSPSGMFISSREPVEAGRDELAERHQVVLVVAIVAARQRGRRGREADRRVGVARRVVAQRQADERGLPGRAESARAARSSSLGSSCSGSSGIDGFGRDDEHRRARRELRRGRQAQRLGMSARPRTSRPAARCPAAA